MPKKTTKTALTRKELFSTLTDEQREVLAEIIVKVALKETNRHYLTKKEADLRESMNSAQCVMLDKVIKAIMGVTDAE